MPPRLKREHPIAMMLKRRAMVDIRASLPPNTCPGRFGTIKNPFVLIYLTHISTFILIMNYDTRKASGEEG
jgi:hypothetical protein